MQLVHLFIKVKKKDTSKKNCISASISLHSKRSDPPVISPHNRLMQLEWLVIKGIV